MSSHATTSARTSRLHDLVEDLVARAWVDERRHIRQPRAACGRRRRACARCAGRRRCRRVRPGAVAGMSCPRFLRGLPKMRTPPIGPKSFSIGLARRERVLEEGVADREVGRQPLDALGVCPFHGCVEVARVQRPRPAQRRSRQDERVVPVRVIVDEDLREERSPRVSEEDERQVRVLGADELGELPDRRPSAARCPPGPSWPSLAPSPCCFMPGAPVPAMVVRVHDVARRP